jgi:pimeloyl-ACP methyl ester carboxylesterase
MPNAAGLYYFAHEVENISRPPVILIHGAGGTHLNWPPQIRRLDDQRIFAVDLPGHGKSEGLGRQAIGEYAECIVEFMKEVGLRAGVIVGHSMGGAIALSLAVEYPERVLGLGLIGTAARMRVDPAILTGLADPASFRSAVHLIAENSYGRGMDPRLKELGEMRMAETRSMVLHGDFVASDSFDLLEHVQRVDIPTLIICGQEDRMTPVSQSRALHAGISNSQLRTINTAGHMLMLEQPHEVAGILTEFLDGFDFRPGQ